MSVQESRRLAAWNIDQLYAPLNASKPGHDRSLVRARSPFAMNALIDALEVINDGQPIIPYEGFKEGQSPPTVVVRDVLKSLNNRSLDRDVLGTRKPNAQPQPRPGEMGINLATVLQTTFEIFIPLLMHQTAFVRSEAAIALNSYLRRSKKQGSGAVGQNEAATPQKEFDWIYKECPAYDHLRRMWIIRFTDCLLGLCTQWVNSSSRSSLIRTWALDIFVLCSDLLRQQANKVTAVSFDSHQINQARVNGIICSQFGRWFELIGSSVRSQPRQSAKQLLDVWPSYALSVAFVLAADAPSNINNTCEGVGSSPLLDYPQVRQLMLILQKAKEGLHREGVMARFLPRCLLTIISNASSYADVAAEPFNALLWGIAQHVTTMCLTFEIATYPTAKPLRAMLSIIIKILDPLIGHNQDSDPTLDIEEYWLGITPRKRDNKLKYVQFQIQSHERRIRAHECILNRRTQKSHRASEDEIPTPIQFAPTLIQIVIEGFSKMRDDLSDGELFVTLNPMLSALVCLGELREEYGEGTLAGAEKPDFSVLLLALISLINKKLDWLQSGDFIVAFRHEASSLDGLTDVTCSVMILNMELTRLKALNWLHWSSEVETLLAHTGDVMQSLLGLNDRESFTALACDLFDVQLAEIYETCIIVRWLQSVKVKEQPMTREIGNHRTSGWPQIISNESLIESIYTIWTMGTAIHWRSKHKAIMCCIVLLKTVILEAPPTRTTFPYTTQLIRMTLEALLYPVAEVRILGRRLIRILGRTLAGTDVSNVRNSIVAPLLNVLDGSVELKTALGSEDRARWREWIFNWHLYDYQGTTGPREGLFKHSLPDREQFKRVLYKLDISAYQGLSELGCGLLEGADRKANSMQFTSGGSSHSRESSNPYLHALRPLVESIEAQLAAGLRKEFHPAITENMQDQMLEALNELQDALNSAK